MKKTILITIFSFTLNNLLSQSIDKSFIKYNQCDTLYCTKIMSISEKRDMHTNESEGTIVINSYNDTLTFNTESKIMLVFNFTTTPDTSNLILENLNSKITIVCNDSILLKSIQDSYPYFEYWVNMDMMIHNKTFFSSDMNMFYNRCYAKFDSDDYWYDYYVRSLDNQSIHFSQLGEHMIYYFN